MRKAVGEFTDCFLYIRFLIGQGLSTPLCVLFYVVERRRLPILLYYYLDFYC